MQSPSRSVKAAEDEGKGALGEGETLPQPDDMKEDQGMLKLCSIKAIQIDSGRIWIPRKR